ncbi:unnamed protein product, partial [Brenthis ino]
MASFKFHFSGTSDESNDKDSGHIEWLKSEEILPSNQLKDLDVLAAQAKMFTCGDVEIGHVVVSNMMNYIKDKGLENVIELAENNHSDLVTGTYEGGLKIWECTYDLVEFFEENPEIASFQKLKVLDLGCGAGILGIYAFLKGAFVTFQDYNKEIIEISTIPNVLLNIDEENIEEEIKRCKFYSGDWESFDKLLMETEKFDIIMTAETIYNQKNYAKLLSLLKNRISESGTIFVAAKTYYFGVGGGTREFETSLKKNDLTSEVVWKTNIGIQREILKIKTL